MDIVHTLSIRLMTQKYSPLKCFGEYFELFEPEAHALGFFGATDFADDSLAAALAFRNRLRKAHLRLFQRHDTALQNLAVEAANQVLVRLVLIFPSYFDCHMFCIIANFPQSTNPYFDSLRRVTVCSIIGVKEN